ncbi:MAG: hypothetical protein IJ398_03485 [Clostridia bacterium]|nr:hypothetical protein [Clostridia bacterium]
MKKQFFKLFILGIICVLCLSMLISCASSDPVDTDTSTENNEGDKNSSDDDNSSTEGSFEEMKNADKALYILNEGGLGSNTNSLTILNYVYFSAKVNGIDVNLTSSGTIQMRHLNTLSDLIYKEELNTTITVNGESSSQYSLTTFDDGKMGLLQTSADKTHAFWSYISQNEFIDFAMPAGEYDITKENCRDISCSTSFDGSYTATFSGFTPSGLEQFEEQLNELKRLVDFKLKDVRLVAIVDKTLKPVELSIDFTFEPIDEEITPIMRVTANYQGFNTTTDVSVDITNYTEIKDIRFLYDNIDAIAYAKYSDNLSATFASNVVLKQYGEAIANETDSTNVSVVENELGYYFVINTTSGGETLKHTYNDGVLTTVYPTGRYVKNDLSTPEARLSIDSYIDITSLNALKISSIAFDGKEYTIQLSEPDVSLCYPIIDALGMTLNDVKSAEGTLTTTIVDGAISKYVYSLNVSLSDGYMITVIYYGLFTYN